jgi:glycosyltransferase domain-containing protein
MNEVKDIPGNVQANSEPLVTIGLPTYNRPLGLQKCLESILQQTYSHLEIIISDNCSTDEAVDQVIKQYTLKDTRIKHFRQNENLGLEENFNFVFARATADYFTWMSDDDYFEVNYIAECVHFLQRNPEHVLCSGIAKYYSGNDFLFNEKMFKVDQRTPFARLFNYFMAFFVTIYYGKSLLEYISAAIGLLWLKWPYWANSLLLQLPVITGQQKVIPVQEIKWLKNSG